MKILSDPLSVLRVIKKNISKYRLVASLILITISIAIITYNICDMNHRQEVFNKLDVTFTEVKAVEYGTPDYDPMTLVENVPYGKIVNYTSTVDINSIGKQTLIFVVEDENVTKVVNVEVEIVDTEKPEITMAEETISIEEGNDVCMSTFEGSLFEIAAIAVNALIDMIFDIVYALCHFVSQDQS